MKNGGPRLLLLTICALILGFVGVVAALVLFRLISLFANVFYYHRFSFVYVEAHSSPFASSPLTLAILAAGGLLAGVAIRYGHRALRGHGIPEVMESVLQNESRIPPRVAVLKPLFAALVIGTGSPFGAEGPIIQTSGALGSLLGQLIEMSPVERKILLGCGAAAGMTGIFGTPIAAVLLVMELILFEFSLRTVGPVAIAAGVAAVGRVYVFGNEPLFPLTVDGHIGVVAALWCIVFGAVAGIEGAALTRVIYWIEDQFERIPKSGLITRPVIGAVFIGLLALIGPEVLGMGYDLIRQVLNDQLTFNELVRVLVFKLFGWTVALSSGTVGGVLAPLFLISGSSGAIIGRLLHGITGMQPGLVALIFMGAVFGSSGRIVLTATVFAAEVTGDFSVLVPVLIATAVACLVADRLLPYNVMTGKLIRRGLRISQDYFAPDHRNGSGAHVHGNEVLQPEPAASDPEEVRVGE